MTYLKSIQFLNKVESEYDVLSIKYKGISIWPYLRIKLFEKVSGADMSLKPSKKAGVRMVLSTLFYYRPFTYFKKSSVWLFTSFERRKRIGDKAIMRVSGGVVNACADTLVIEKPGDAQSKTPHQDIKEKRIVSESWILLFVHAYALLLKPFRIAIDGENVLHQIIQKNGLIFDYESEIRLLFAQKKTIDILFKFAHIPQKIFIECPYSVMGYVWSMHEHGIRVTELQHGVLNKNHYAYNSLFHSKELYPDQICVFGDIEYDYLMENNCYYCKNVVRTGLFFLEISDQSFITDIFSAYRKEYKFVVLVSGQTGYEKQLSEFVNIIAASSKDIIFVYVPRTNDESLEFCETNIIFCPGVNIYEYMKWCDVHLTISSTTCLECQYFKKPTLFYDYDGLASNYYKSVLSGENGVYYMNNVTEFEDAFSFIENNRDAFKYKDIFAHGSVDRIKHLIFD